MKKLMGGQMRSGMKGRMMAHPGGSVPTAPKHRTETLMPSARIPGVAGMKGMKMEVVGEQIGYVSHPSKLFTGKHPDGHKRGSRMYGHMEQDLNKRSGKRG